MPTKKPYRDLIVEASDTLLVSLGSNSAQRRDVAETDTLTSALEMRQGTVVITETGDPIDSEAGRKWLQTNKPHLLPPESQPDEVADAFAVFNMTKRQGIVAKVGLAEANRLAATYGLRDIFERKAGTAPGDAGNTGKSAGNPWLDSDPIRRTQRIASFIGAHGAAKSASMARLANKTIDGKELRTARTA
jgi:hypothetical protein